MVALVLLPGLDGTGLLFKEFVDALGDDLDVIVVSYPNETPLGYGELESTVRNHLPSDQPFYLLGESFSGPIALSIAASSPPALLGVILCCSFARNPLPVFAPLRFLLLHLPLSAPPVSLLSFFLTGRFSAESLRAQLRRVLALVKPDVLRFRAHAALTVDVSDTLAHIKVPLLYLNASEDRVVGRSSGEQIIASVSDARLVEFSAPHFLLQVLPEASAQQVGDFISAITKRAL